MLFMDPLYPALRAQDLRPGPPTGCGTVAWPVFHRFSMGFLFTTYFPIQVCQALGVAITLSTFRAPRKPASCTKYVLSLRD